MAKLTDKFFNRVIEGPLELTEEEAKRIAQEGVYLVDDVKTLSNEVISQLKAGDIVVKHDNSGNHPYIVSFRGETGICLTYTDASCIETQSYDKVGQNWVYNSEDKTPNLLELPAKMEDIKDKDGHNRFIEGDITIEQISGITQSYGKWSLSGTHLLIVVGVDIANGTVISSGDYLAYVNIPKWILDKIIPLASNRVDLRTLPAYNDNTSTTQNFNCLINKLTDKLGIFLAGTTATDNRHLRIAFDLLIDNE